MASAAISHKTRSRDQEKARDPIDKYLVRFNAVYQTSRHDLCFIAVNINDQYTC
jgi:hypothetical protein